MRLLPKHDYQYFLALYKSICSFKKSGLKNPHKQLLLLFSLELLKLRGSSELKYSVLHKRIISILRHYSKSKIVNAAYPFWYLQNDLLWEVFASRKLKFRSGKEEPSHASLIESEAVGKLPYWLEKILSKKPELVLRAANIIAKEIDPEAPSILISRIDQLLADES
jgi:hypothetical protein